MIVIEKEIEQELTEELLDELGLQGWRFKELRRDYPSDGTTTLYLRDGEKRLVSLSVQLATPNCSISDHNRIIKQALIDYLNTSE